MKKTLAAQVPLVFCALAGSLMGNTLCVNSTLTPGCFTTVQAAINSAAPGDTINIAAGTYQENLSITQSVTLNGAGAASTILDGGNAGRVITIVAASASVVNISNVTVQHGRAFIHGGGIANGDFNPTVPAATLNISNSVITANHAGHYGGGGSNQESGGIITVGPLTLVNSTVSNNSSNGDAGGIGIFSGATALIANSTITGNTAGDTECCGFGAGAATGGNVTIVNTTISGNTSYAGYGGGIGNGSTLTISFSTISNNSGAVAGGISNFGNPATIKNSIIANNTGGPDCGQTPNVSLGGNFDTSGTCGFTVTTAAALNLGPLQLNAPGSTATQALLPPSAAIDAAVDCLDALGALVTTDQRGVLRPQGPACDSGAFEAPPPTAASVTAEVASLLPMIGSSAVADLTASLTAAAASIAKGNNNAAKGQLGAFINKVQALQNSHRLDTAIGNQLIGSAQYLIAHL